MRYAYYPGCSAESTARDMHQSTLAVADALGIEMIEPKGFEFSHPGYAAGRLFMNIDGDVVTLKLRLGSFAKKVYVTFEKPLKTD